MSTTPTLKPCPFCGGAPTISQGIEEADQAWRISCESRECGVIAECQSGFTKEENIVRWNTRALETELALCEKRLATIAEVAHATLIPSGATGEFYREELLRIRSIATIGKPGPSKLEAEYAQSCERNVILSEHVKRIETELAEAQAKLAVMEAQRDYHLACHEAKTAKLAKAKAALERLRDCDWVITPANRMDAVRDIARAALRDMEGEG